MSFLANFLAEHEAPPQNVSVVKESKSVSVETVKNNSGGQVLIVGSNDWDNATKDPRGLNEIHRIDFEGRTVKDCFSSSFAYHSFFLVNESKGKNKVSVYAVGANNKGQLGTGDSLSSQLPIKISPTTEVIKKIAVGRYHSIILTESGLLLACGANICGQLGQGKSFEESFAWKSIKTVHPVVDVACGHQHSIFCDTAGHVYTFGHPEYGQLGHGHIGEYIKQAGKMDYTYVVTPKRVEEFISKDSKNKITSRRKFDEIFIVAVAAGKNHSLCVESSQVDQINGSSGPHLGRVYSWGFGGYGRLGHNGTSDELVPRSIDTFTNLCNSGHPTKPMYRDNCITRIYAGNNVSVAITKSKRMYVFGAITSSSSKESNMYPKEISDLVGCHIDSVSLGFSCIYVLSGSEVYAWGNSAGAMGFADTKTSTTPKEIDLRGVEAFGISSGYLHTYILVSDKPGIKNWKPTSSNSSSSDKKKRGFAGVVMQPTVCPFDASSQVNSYFPVLEALAPIDAEERKAKAKKKQKTDKNDEESGDEEQSDNGNESESASDNDESESEDDDDDDSDDNSNAKGSNKRGRGRK